MIQARDFAKTYQDAPGLHSAKMDALAQFTERQLTCSHCGKCTRRCEVLNGPTLDIGQIQRAYDHIMTLPEKGSARTTAVLQLVEDDPALYNALRQCCFCGYCTAACRHHVPAPEAMRAWRELFMQANLMPPDDSKLVMVDNEWNIFSAYRAIYGIAYPEFVSLAQAAEANSTQQTQKIDTLFFPGCSLVSYAPDVVRTVGAWLTDSGVNWCLSDGCCGSPLMSAGLFDRAAALRASFVDQMQAAGIKRLVTVCPGCADEFRDDLTEDIEIVPFPQLMLQLAKERQDAGRPTGFNPMPQESLTFFDSCHDRYDSSNAKGIRALAARYLPQAHQIESEHFMRGTLCCGAGGAVASYDPDITDRRVWQVIDEARATGAQTLVTMCPTCTYTVAQALLSAPDVAAEIESLHYLELLFGVKIDWAQVFYQLSSMWTGEYGPWLATTFF